MKISLNGYGENIATFKFTSLVAQGQPVTMEENFTVRPCAESESFIGMAIDANGEYASVQLDGYVRFGYSGTAPSVGICKLAADGNGNVCVNDNGREFIVTDVDTDNGTVGIIL